MTDPARNRFLVISFVRLAGAGLTVLGLVISSGRWPDVPPPAGIAVVLLGVFGFAVAPRLLARRWRSPQ
ncbi:hypothetical protein HJG53_08605 [Sphingomonas sp. ID1715]|uniref:hypothetical protein n=1 Tax=Sphingomonas sp. ID1715 TaxID=1656898 RepID=UPI001487C41A|nr:hypothetical protein [Sphingomonas sp. ID1715]NNM76959.1 hypothetical protein [Sphingomonas sp. ID1715]